MRYDSEQTKRQKSQISIMAVTLTVRSERGKSWKMAIDIKLLSISISKFMNLYNNCGLSNQRELRKHPSSLSDSGVRVTLCAFGIIFDSVKFMFESTNNRWGREICRNSWNIALLSDDTNFCSSPSLLFNYRVVSSPHRKFSAVIYFNVNRFKNV